jgi:hypothetical protein
MWNYGNTKWISDRAVYAAIWQEQVAFDDDDQDDDEDDDDDDDDYDHDDGDAYWINHIYYSVPVSYYYISSPRCDN